MANEYEHELVVRLPLDLKYVSSDQFILEELWEYRSLWKTLKTPQVFCSGLPKLTWPCTVMQRIRGMPLSSVWTRATVRMRISIARQMGAIYRDLLNTQSPVAGVFGKSSGTHTQTFPLEPLGSQEATTHSGQNKILNRLAKHPNREELMSLYRRLLLRSRTMRNPYECIMTALDWRTFLCDVGCPGPIYSRSTFEAYKLVVDDMHRMGVFSIINMSETPFSLWHIDLFPRNIMVDISPEDDTAEISGVIDWDKAMFAPSFAASSPQWMWRNCYFWKVKCCGRDIEIEQFAHQDCGPHNDDSIAVKEAFFESAGPLWRMMADDPAFVMARKVLDIAIDRRLTHIDGASSDDEAWRLLGDWNNLLLWEKFQRAWAFVVDKDTVRKSVPGVSYEETVARWGAPARFDLTREAKQGNQKQGSSEWATWPLPIAPPPKGSGHAEPEQGHGHEEEASSSESELFEEDGPDEEYELDEDVDLDEVEELVQIKDLDQFEDIGGRRGTRQRKTAGRKQRAQQKRAGQRRRARRRAQRR